MTLVANEPVNTAPSFTPGPPIVTGYPGELTTIPWASNLNPGAPEEAGQALSFLLTNPSPALFSQPPSIDATGRLSFVPRLEASGRVRLTVRLQDDGGTANGGQDQSAPVDLELQLGCDRPTEAPLELNLSMAAKVTLAVPGGSPQDVLAVDLDGDGRPDLVTANPDSGSFQVFLNRATPGAGLSPDSFAAPAAIPAGGGFTSLAAGDLNRDGKPELLANAAVLGTIQILPNESVVGNLSFGDALSIPNPPVASGGTSSDVAIGDLDRDGLPDLVVANPEDGLVVCYRNLSTGAAIVFSEPLRLPAGSRPHCLAIADVDGDGRADLVVANQAPAGLTLIHNASIPGSLSFGSTPAVAVASGAVARLQVADLDRDGKRDVVGAVPALGGILIWRNISQVGAFHATTPPPLAAPGFVATDCEPHGVAVAEIDGDGYPDLVVANFGANNTTVLGNRSVAGRIEFTVTGTFPTSRGPLAVALADLDGDLRSDLVAADYLGGRLQIRRNQAAREVVDEIAFSLSGAMRPITDLAITARSSNQAMIADGDLRVTGSGSQRTLLVAPQSGVSGASRITVRLVDAGGRIAENELTLLVGCAVNTIWTEACTLGLAGAVDGSLHATIQQALQEPGEARWYRFQAQPESQLFLVLSGLPDDYDLFLFQDIEEAYGQLTSTSLTPADLVALNARYAPAAYSPAAYSPAAYSPMVYSPAAYSPAAYSPAAYSPMAYSPAAYSPAAYSPAAYSADAFSPAAYSPAAYSGPAEAPVAFSPAAYSGAQTQSLLAASAFDGTANEGIFMNTWTSTGEYFVCVRGRDGRFSPDRPFRLDVHLIPGECGALDASSIPASNTPVTRGPGAGYRTLIVTDFTRLDRRPPQTDAQEWSADLATLRSRLTEFASRPEVAGTVVDVGTDAGISAANAQADRHFDCVHAKNVVAGLIRDVVLRFQASNPALEYVVLVGSDDVIPNFRYPDNAPLGVEQGFVPPVRDATSSQAALRLGYFMSQDAYGALCEFRQKLTSIPLPALAVGRLVETPAEIRGQLEAYLGLAGGRLQPATSSLVTGYEFLADVAERVHEELRAGIGEGAGLIHEALISPAGLSPDADPLTTANWSADELAQMLLGRRHDVIFLAGHYNDGSALAADYQTELTAREVAESPVDLQYSVVFGAGCHVGYNTVDLHSQTGVTQSPDWAQALARKRATLIGGWGYQYGDTELLEYSERLYLHFARQLRNAPPGGAVAIGDALMRAKRQYLEETDDLRGIHEKALLQVALFGLPMLRVDLPHKAPSGSDLEPVVDDTSNFGTDPGRTLGLGWKDLTIDTAPLKLETRALGVYAADGTRDGTIEATYWSGPQGAVSHPAEPVLPLVAKDVTHPDAGQVLRGIGFRGGSYHDELAVLQLTGTPATEFRGTVLAFQSAVFHPVQPWSLNALAGLCTGEPARTRLNLTPVQYRTDWETPELGTRRVFSELDLRLYYSGNVTTYTEPPGQNADTPALADAPSIVWVRDAVAGASVTIEAAVLGNPAAGIQEVWITYTAETGDWHGRWHALDLTQDATVSSQWAGVLTLPPGLDPSQLRYAVHAVNGVGLVTMNANRGKFFVPGERSAAPTATALTLDGFPLTGRFGTTATFSAVLTAAGEPVQHEAVRFGLGSQQVQAWTDAEGRATAALLLQGLPAQYTLQVTFGGSALLASASASTGFEILRQPTVIAFEDLTVTRPHLNVVATLADAERRPVAESAVFFVLTDSHGAVRLARAVSTDRAGRAPLGIVPLGAGTHTLRAYFNDRVPLPPAGGLPTELEGTWELDPRYEAATQTATYVFEPVAVDATILRSLRRTAKIPVASLLEAAQGFAVPVRVQSAQDAEPAGAGVSIEEGWIIYTPPGDDAAPGSFTYTLADDEGNSATGRIDVIVRPDDDPTLNLLSITRSADGSMQLRFIGVPGLEYRVQARDTLDPKDAWSELARVTAGPNGEFEFIDREADTHTTRYYRAYGP